MNQMLKQHFATLYVSLGDIYQGRIQDLWLGGGGGGVSRRGVWGPLKVPSWSRAEPW